MASGKRGPTGKPDVFKNWVFLRMSISADGGTGTSQEGRLGPRVRRKLNSSAICLAKMMAAMMGPGASSKMLADESGFCLSSVKIHLLAMRREGVAHIARWERHPKTGRCIIPCYALGRLPDAKKPVRDRLEVVRRYRARRKYKAQIAHLSPGLYKHNLAQFEKKMDAEL